MNNPLSDETLLVLFQKSARNSNCIATHEGITVEFKQSFGWASRFEYMRAMAAFSNRDGGYIIFGIKNKPHILLGLDENALSRFDSIDNAAWSTEMKNCFSPEIIWERRTYECDKKTYGIFYAYPAVQKPVICKRNESSGKDLILRKAAIYYRYNAQNTEIEYPELNKIIETEKNKINQQWMSIVTKLGNNGISDLALLDFSSGRLSGNNATLYIDDNLLRDISFIKEGHFVETNGAPALILRGEVQTISGAKKMIVRTPEEKSINADEIIKVFLSSSDVFNSKEYIKQIAYEDSPNFPIYYYIRKAGLSIDDTIAMLDAIPTNSKMKTKLKERLASRTTKYMEFPCMETALITQKKQIRDSILKDQCKIPTKLDDIRHFADAMRYLTAKEIRLHKETVLLILRELYQNYFNNPEYQKTKAYIRYAICWIDEALYMEGIQ